ncbi:PEX22 [Candida pseudojiufengensis]|uniref:PEX22 n=1 Tax=Candida pseudojiufengensis TaxID=497109 RepID=UPI002225A66F|nr:PEX22 [Candida pseudojiufengensis]KAI5966173.1 PEX22 [Candida pseudojiufengensis]
MMSRKAQRNPKLYIAAVIATSTIAISYKIYDTFIKSKTEEEQDKEIDTIRDQNNTSLLPKISNFNISKKYINKQIAITLSSSFLSSTLPLQDIIKTQENMIFIIPPNLNEEDLDLNEQNSENQLTQTNSKIDINNNFKILKCSNFQGYLQILKNLKPDLLLLCSDDLGINFNNLSYDLNNFITKIINIDQNKDLILQIKPIIFN